MHIITIRDRHQTDQGFEAAVSFDSESEHRITVANLFGGVEEATLAWYFEQWTRTPSAEDGSAPQATDSVKDYGQQLFEQVFGSNEDVYTQYCELRDRFSQIEISIESRSPEFQAMHWEALWDPALDEPLAVQCTMVRRLIPPEAMYDGMAPSPYLDMLLVTARPGEEDDAGYRTIARPLTEAIDRAQLPVRVTHLRPATYEALEKHLQARENYYHIVHFDAHGTLLSHGQLEALRKGGRQGEEGLPGYKGYRAFLLLEGGRRGMASLIEVNTLAGLLRDKGVPVCLVNASRPGKPIFSAKETGAQNVPPPITAVRETSIASRLVAAGLRTVVATGCSTTAATVFLERLYAQLLDHRLLPDAVRDARRSLYNHRQDNGQAKQSCAGQAVDLEDWLLPTVYCREDVDLNLREFTAQEAEFFADEANTIPKALNSSFVGRDLDILKLERSLDRHNIVLLQGAGGAGKTTLLKHLQNWWQTTRFAEKVLYFSYDQQAWTVEQIVLTISHQVYNPFELDDFQTVPLPDKIDKLSELLKASPYVLMFDSLESATGQPLVIANSLEPDQQQALKTFLETLKGGGTKVVLASRNSEEWLEPVLNGGGPNHHGPAPAPSREVNRYVLPGLDPDARSHLAQAILARQGKDTEAIAKLLQDSNFKQLMTLLAGYPLAMEVILANLRQQQPEAVLAALQAQGTTPTGEAIAPQTGHIVNCVAYSYGQNLSSAAQKLLLCLAPFKTVFRRDCLPQYIRQLQQQDAFKDYPFEQLDEMVAAALGEGLLSRLEEDVPSILALSPAFSYALDTKMRALDEQTQRSLRLAFNAYYREMGDDYRELINSKAGHERRTGLACCRLEYENLYQVLQIGLDEQDSIDVFYCLRDFLRISNDLSGWLALSKQVYDIQAQYPTQIRTGKLGIDIAMVAGDLATCYLLSQDYLLAENLYQESIAVAHELTGIDERLKQLKLLAVSFHQLGIVAQKQQQWQQAKDYFNKALLIKIEYGDTSSQANTYHQLGVVAQEQWQWQQAIDYFNRALTIKIECGDFPSQANTYYQLGVVAQEQRQWPQALDYFNQALAIKIKYRDRSDQARIYARLGAIAQEQRLWQQAAEDYGRALDVYVEHGDRASQARTHHNLGVVAQERRLWQQAVDHYSQALTIYAERGDRTSQARTCYNLGVVLREQRQWQQAADYFSQSLTIYTEYGDRSGQARAYFQLGILAEEWQRWHQAKTYYAQALEIYVGYGDRYNQARVYARLGRVAEAKGDWTTAVELYLEDLRITVEFQDEAGLQDSMQNIARVYRECRDEAFLAQAVEIMGEDADALWQAILVYGSKGRP
ncbi:MAG: tetratricopeptide repeat protein [Elainellaceae cyanobacterium]